MKRSLLTLTGLILMAGTLEAQLRAGGEFRVNTYTTGHQYFPAAAFDRDGDFVVVWSSYQGALGEVVAQRYEAGGARAGAEFIVNTTTAGYQYMNQVGTPVAMRPDGRFVVVWSSVVGGAYEVRAQRFEANGARAGAEFQVDVGVPANSYYPNVAIATHGTFVVVWSGDVFANQDVFGQVFDATGNRLGLPFRVNSTTAGVQTAPRVAMDDDGAFVVLWQDRGGQDGSGHGVFGQRFGPGGARVGAEFQVNTYTTGNQYAYGVARAADGRFVVSWDSSGDGSGFGIFGRRYDVAGAPVGADFLVNQDTTGSQTFSSIATDLHFNFVASWQSTAAAGDPSGYGVRGQRFSAQGTRRGLEFGVNTYTTASQHAANVAVDHVGNFLVTWQSNNQDGNQLGVFAQRYGGLGPRALRVATSGNGVLEPGEIADVRPTWRNVNGAAQTFTGTLADPNGPPGGVPQIVASTADYGTVPNGVSAECAACYSVVIPNPSPRPVLHWDGTVLETIVPDAQGQQKTWRLHVGDSFSDVPTANGFYRFVETLLHHGVTSGCTASTYCPGGATSREQMAVFVLVAKEGAGYVAPACGATPMFADVPTASPFCRWVEELARRGVVAGCGGGNYCPSAPVSREQMAVFVLRALDPSLNPIACVPPNLFADVPETNPFCRWVEELANRGVVTGCGGGNYCPNVSVTRQEMGVFISVTFGLALYGP